MTHTVEIAIRPSLLRYLGVMLYDTLLLLSVLLLAGLVAVAANSGNAISQGNPFFTLYLLAVSFLFYGWFWTHGGQTLGMRSWKVKLISVNSSEISWKQALFRFIFAAISWIPAGLGFWWQYIMKDKESWPDMMSDTFLHYDKKSKPKPLSRLS